MKTETDNSELLGLEAEIASVRVTLERIQRAIIETNGAIASAEAAVPGNAFDAFVAGTDDAAADLVELQAHRSKLTAALEEGEARIAALTDRLASVRRKEARAREAAMNMDDAVADARESLDAIDLAELKRTAGTIVASVRETAQRMGPAWAAFCDARNARDDVAMRHRVGMSQATRERYEALMAAADAALEQFDALKSAVASGRKRLETLQEEAKDNAKHAFRHVERIMIAEGDAMATLGQAWNAYGRTAGTRYMGELPALPVIERKSLAELAALRERVLQITEFARADLIGPLPTLVDFSRPHTFAA